MKKKELWKKKNYEVSKLKLELSLSDPASSSTSSAMPQMDDDGLLDDPLADRPD